MEIFSICAQGPGYHQPTLSVLNAKQKRFQMAEEGASLAEMAASLTPKVKVVSDVEPVVPSVIV